LCYYTAARYLQLAELVTIYFSSPLLVAVLAILLLKEQVGWSRWASLAIGFAGVVIACRPGGTHAALPIVLAVTAAMLWASSTVLIRQIVHAESTPVLMLATNGMFFVVCGALMLWHWRQPSLGELALMILVGVLAAVAQYISTEAIRRAPATVVSVISF